MKTINDSFKQLFLGLYRMVIADNDKDPREMQTLYQIGRDYGITNDEINDAIVNDYGVELYSPETLELKIRYLYALSQIAWADGVIVPEEKELLMVTAERLGFEKQNLEGIVEFLLGEAKKKIAVDDVIKMINND